MHVVFWNIMYTKRIIEQFCWLPMIILYVVPIEFYILIHQYTIPLDHPSIFMLCFVGVKMCCYMILHTPLKIITPLNRFSH